MRGTRFLQEVCGVDLVPVRAAQCRLGLDQLIVRVDRCGGGIRHQLVTAFVLSLDRFRCQ